MRSIRLSRKNKQENQLEKNNDQASLKSEGSTGKSTNEGSSLAFLVRSMCPLTIDANYRSLLQEDDSQRKVSFPGPSEVNGHLCKICKRSGVANQYDTCISCRRKSMPVEPSQQTPFEGSWCSESSSVQSAKAEKTINISGKDAVQNGNHKDVSMPSTNESKQQCHRDTSAIVSNSDVKRNSNNDQSLSASSAHSQSCVASLILRVNLDPQTQSAQSVAAPNRLSNSNDHPVSHSMHLSATEIAHYKQREIELFRSANELIEQLRTRMKETTNQISKYWSYMKQISLHELQPKASHSQLLEYVTKSSSAAKQFECFAEENDEIKASLEVLKTTLLIVRNRCTTSIVNQSFDEEEKQMKENSVSTCDSDLTTYSDRLSLIHECSLCYQASVSDETNARWIEIIKIDYPSLMEKISEDFVRRNSHISEVLVEMLKNVRKRVLDKTDAKRDQ